MGAQGWAPLLHIDDGYLACPAKFPGMPGPGVEFGYFDGFPPGGSDVLPHVMRKILDASVLHLFFAARRKIRARISANMGNTCRRNSVDFRNYSPEPTILDNQPLSYGFC